MVLARAARAVDEVVLQVRVAERDVDHAVDRGLGERRTTEIRVDEHAGGVQHAPELRPPCRRELRQRPFREVAGIGAGLDLLARPLERRPRRLERGRMRLGCQALVAQQHVHGREVAEPHKASVSRDACLTIGVLRRVRLAVTAVILVAAGTAVTAVAARDAYYVDRPLPGVVVRDPKLTEPVTVVVDGRRVAVRARARAAGQSHRDRARGPGGRPA